MKNCPLREQTGRQIVEGLTGKMKWIRFRKQFWNTIELQRIHRLHEPFVCNRKSIWRTNSCLYSEADYLQKRRLNDLKISWNQLIKMVLFLGRVLFRLIMLFLLSRDYMMLRLAKLIKSGGGCYAWHDINLIQKEGLSDSAFWWGNIHLNTNAYSLWSCQ